MNCITPLPRNYQRVERRLRQRLFHYSVVLGSIGCGALGLYLVQRDGSLSWEARLSSVGTGLLASAAFALVFTLLVDRERDALLLTRLRESLDDHRESMLQTWRHDQLLYMPLQRYPPTESFDRAFNRDLMASIADSSIYYFQGVSAKYVPIRLNTARHCPGSVVVIVPHPASPAIRRRVSDRIKNPKYAGRTAEQLQDEIRQEILESLVGLFDCRHLASSQVIFAQETAVTRVELTDRGVFVTWYHGVESRGQPFPETIRFGPGSFYYQVGKLDMIRTIELAGDGDVVRFDYRTTEDEARGTIASLFDMPKDDVAIPELRSAYSARMRDFDNFIRNTGAQ